MYCTVAPLRRFPRTAEPFDYRIPEHLTLQVGCFVRVPLRGSLVEGVVVELMETTAYKRVRDVSKLLDRAPLSKPALDFYQALAKRTYQSLSSILLASLPPSLKRSVKLADEVLEGTAVRVSKEEAASLVEVCKAWKEKKTLRVASPSDAYSIALAVMAARRMKGLLVICPDQLTVQAVSRVIKAVRDDVLTYTGGMSKSASLRAVEAIRTGGSVVVSTRVGALIVPPKETDVFVIGAGDDELFQHDQNPHYDARWCVNWFARHQGNNLLLIDVLPRLEEGPVDVDLWATPSSTELIDMKQTAKISDHYLLSPKVKELLETCDTSKQAVYLYFNRKGRARALQCLDCGSFVSCSTCGQPGRLYDSAIACVRCQKKGAHPSSCKGCGGQKLSEKGIGIEGVARLVKKNSPHHDVQVVGPDDELPAAGIVLLTSTLFNKVHPLQPSFAALVVLQADHEFVHRGFRSMENASRALRRLVSLAHKARARCLVQTWSLHSVQDALAPTGELQKSEGELRAFLGYPPYKDIVLVSSKKDGKLLEQFAKNDKESRTNGQFLAKKLPVEEVVSELGTWPQSCDIVVNPDTLPEL